MGRRSSSTASTTSSSSSDHVPQPRKMTFMEQVNKRKVCEKLVTFLRLIDYMLKFILHNIACNSLSAVHKALVARAAKSKAAETGPKAAAATSTHKDAAAAAAAAAAADEDQEVPVFLCQVTVQNKEITVSPDLQVSLEGLQSMCKSFLE